MVNQSSVLYGFIDIFLLVVMGPSSCVILSAAKDLVRVRRSFAALRMTWFRLVILRGGPLGPEPQDDGWGGPVRSPISIWPG
jgi:hypothetical protein